MEKTIADVLEKILDPEDKTAGGGSASAFSGAMAAGMLGMVADLSVKKAEGAAKERLLTMQDELAQLKEALLQGVVEDTQAYQGIVKAFALAKATEEEKALRRQAVEDAALYAASVPLQNGMRNERVFAIGREMRPISNPACYSDLKSALYLAKGAVKDCVFNAQANLPLMKKEENVRQVREQMLDLLLKVL